MLPALAIGFTWALWRGNLRPRSWLAIVLLQAALFGAGLAALKTGQHEEERVESAVPKTALETHEALAEQFLWIAGITLAAGGIVLVLRRPRAVQVFTAVTVLGSLLTAGAALRVGHAGGQLVYVHNAAATYATTGKANAQAGSGAIQSPSAESSAADKDDN